MSFQGKMDHAVADAMDALSSDKLILIGFEDRGAMFQVWSGVGDGVALSDVEAALITIMEQAKARAAAGGCAGCEACRTRVSRLTAAIAALSNGGPEIARLPEGAVH